LFQRGDQNLDVMDRKEVARPSQLQWLRAPHFLCISIATAGTLALLGACLYRRLRHPEWTGGQALQALWPIYLAGVSSICIGWLFNAKGK
jgi:hypothetical protein